MWIVALSDFIHNPKFPLWLKNTGFHLQSDLKWSEQTKLYSLLLFLFLQVVDSEFFSPDHIWFRLLNLSRIFNSSLQSQYLNRWKCNFVGNILIFLSTNLVIWGFFKALPLIRLCLISLYPLPSSYSLTLYLSISWFCFSVQMTIQHLSLALLSLSFLNTLSCLIWNQLIGPS